MSTELKRIKNVFIDGAISPNYIAESIAHHQVKTKIGAHSIFLGQVRADTHTSGTTTGIEYEAYQDLANEKMHEIREWAFVNFDLTCLHIYHSLGSVKVGDVSLFVFTSAPHRKAAIEACSQIVERIKAEVPVWGKEILDTGEIVWKKNK